MCKAHFHPFAVIISPFNAIGMQWGSKLTPNIFCLASTPGRPIWNILFTFFRIILCTYIFVDWQNPSKCIRKQGQPLITCTYVMYVLNLKSSHIVTLGKNTRHLSCREKGWGTLPTDPILMLNRGLFSATNDPIFYWPEKQYRFHHMWKRAIIIMITLISQGKNVTLHKLEDKLAAVATHSLFLVQYSLYRLLTRVSYMVVKLLHVLYMVNSVHKQNLGDPHTANKISQSVILCIHGKHCPSNIVRTKSSETNTRQTKSVSTLLCWVMSRQRYDAKRHQTMFGVTRTWWTFAGGPTALITGLFWQH
jgi:hypothetical protein